ncbi:MAG: Fe(3+) ABC transporter substrate-binding protein [Desulfovibrio sp.]|nr:Fe(3+) ABC transporter substrate-binding protein [Desulfovibrio sp.]
MKKSLLTFFGCLLAFGSSSAAFAANDAVVNIYTARHYESDKALYALFEKETGIKVNVVSGKAPELIERIKREGDATNADLFITVDGGVLHTAKAAGILQPVASKAVLQNIPASLRDRENYWIGLTTRARVIVYSKDRVKPEQLSTYEDLADPKWRGKFVARPSSSLYDQSLIASLISLNGEAKTLEWVKGVVANFARPPKGNDRGQAKDIVAGLADLTLMNTYYIGQMLHSKDAEEVKVAQQVGVFFPNQATTGTHINVSGIALTKHAKNMANAVRFMEFLTAVPAQEQLSAENYEYPANPKAQIHPLLKSWGEFKAQSIDFSVLGTNNAKAVQLVTEGGWK